MLSQIVYHCLSGMACLSMGTVHQYMAIEAGMPVKIAIFRTAIAGQRMNRPAYGTVVPLGLRGAPFWLKPLLTGISQSKAGTAAEMASSVVLDLGQQSKP